MPDRRAKAIIIGATSGIGLALAELLDSKNYELGLTGRRIHLIEKFRSGDHHLVAMDVAEIEPSRQALAELIREMGRVDLIILNSGRGNNKPRMEWENEKRTIDVNVSGIAALANIAFEHFQQQGGGHLVGISSVAAIRGGGGHPAYNASKAFLSNYLQGLRHVAHRTGLPIYITDIKPGFVDTAMAKGDGVFWVASTEKAARQIFDAIMHRRKHAYITKRWALVGWLLRWLPDWIVYRR